MTQTALITGATRGIGEATALQLAQKGYHVILHGRQATSCQAAIHQIRRQVPEAELDFLTADLSRMDQVAQLAEEVIDRVSDLNVLILNAGTFSKQRIMTPEGLEQTWAVNYLSRFLLVQKLLPLLTHHQPSRIVDISGTYHSRGQLHVEDIHLAQGYDWNKANSQSKLANVLFTYRMARQLAHTQVSINTLHPGVVNTGSVLRSPDMSRIAKWLYRLFSPLFQSPAQAASTLVYVATSPEMQDVSGQYLSKRKVVKSSTQSYDEDLQDILWKLSLEMLAPYL